MIIIRRRRLDALLVLYDLFVEELGWLAGSVGGGANLYAVRNFLVVKSRDIPLGAGNMYNDDSRSQYNTGNQYLQDPADAG